MRPRLGASVKLPSQSDVEDRLLHFLYRYGRPIEPKDLYGPLADDFQLTQEQRLARRRDRDEPAWHNRVQWAKRHLVGLGFIDKNSPRGWWSLTTRGRERAAMIEHIKSLTEDEAMAALGGEPPRSTEGRPE
jgi:restriction endonuclease Mrr